MFRLSRNFLGGTGRRFASTRSRFTPVRTLDCTQEAADNAFPQDEPVLFTQRFGDLPAISKWFEPLEADSGFHRLNSSYFEKYGSAVVPLELTRHNTSGMDNKSSFDRFDAPLSLLLSHMDSLDTSLSLYLAQCSLGELPLALQADLPAPKLLKRIGRGDIYASSLWMGRPPTKTPLHRDPNPNLFIQLAGRKVIRLLRPNTGRMLYESLRVGKGHPNMRGEEMMVGEEMENLESAIWDDDNPHNENFWGVEAELKSGEALQIPLGWWHAVHGVGKGANASVNWWFR